MIPFVALAAALACQAAPAPAAPQTGGDFLRSQPRPDPAAVAPPAAGAGSGFTALPAPPTGASPLIIRKPEVDWSKTPPAAPQADSAAPAPSVADLFRERNAREAAARDAAARASADRSEPVPDGVYRCRRSDTGFTCGDNEAAMQETEARAREMLQRQLGEASKPQD